MGLLFSIVADFSSRGDVEPHETRGSSSGKPTPTPTTPTTSTPNSPLQTARTLPPFKAPPKRATKSQAKAKAKAKAAAISSKLQKIFVDIVFYDLETTFLNQEIIEYAAVVLDKTSFFEKEVFSSLVFSSKITDQSRKVNQISLEMVKDAPKFEDIAPKIFELMDGKVWAGHNVSGFDNHVLKKNFERINQKPPEPLLVIDTLFLLRAHFGPRPGNLKLASLCTYYQLGEEKHRALDDVKKNIEVLKNCCMTLFLEQSFEIDLSPSEGGGDEEDEEESDESDNEEEKKKEEKPKGNEKEKEKKEKEKVKEKDEQGGEQVDNKEKEQPLSIPTTKTTIYPTPSPSSFPSGSSSYPSAEYLVSSPHFSVIIEKINQAMKEQKEITICYNGGSDALVPRKISPLSWAKANVMFIATCEKSKTDKNFLVCKIDGIKD